MISVRGQNRRFTLLKTRGGIIKIAALIIVGCLLVLLGIFLYQNIATTVIFGSSMLIIVVWLLQTPKPVAVSLDEQNLTINNHAYSFAQVDSWSLIDLAEAGQLLFKIKGEQSLREVYIQKEDLASSGLINALTQVIPFNGELVNTNPITLIFRTLGLY